MRISIVASHAWALPSPARTGDSQILLDLSRSLVELGHEVWLVAPARTIAPPGVVLLPMPFCSNGQATPSTEQCEEATLEAHFEALQACQVIHDCSVGKLIHAAFPDKALTTIWGGPWRHAHHPRNVVAQSNAQRERLMRGATDYEGTDTPEMGGPNGVPIGEVRTVWNGIDTEAPHGYAPTGKPKQDFFLMLGRWHPVRGIEQGIELAKATGINLLIAGTDPEEDHPAQAAYARQICELVRGHDNISVEFLPMGEAHHARKVELFSDAKCILFMPLFNEPFGLPQAEAMACGTPVLGLDVGSVREVCGHAFRDAAEILEASRGIRPFHGDMARRRAVERFDRRVMASNYLALYEAVAGGHGWG